jgi:hypothetical protein
LIRAISSTNRRRSGCSGCFSAGRIIFAAC